MGTTIRMPIKRGKTGNYDPSSDQDTKYMQTRHFLVDPESQSSIDSPQGRCRRLVGDLIFPILQSGIGDDTLAYSHTELAPMAPSTGKLRKIKHRRADNLFHINKKFDSNITKKGGKKVPKVRKRTATNNNNAEERCKCYLTRHRHDKTKMVRFTVVLEGTISACTAATKCVSTLARFRRRSDQWIIRAPPLPEIPDAKPPSDPDEDYVDPGRQFVCRNPRDTPPYAQLCFTVTVGRSYVRFLRSLLTIIFPSNAIRAFMRKKRTRAAYEKKGDTVASVEATQIVTESFIEARDYLEIELERLQSAGLP